MFRFILTSLRASEQYVLSYDSIIGVVHQLLSHLLELNKLVLQVITVLVPRDVCIGKDYWQM